MKKIVIALSIFVMGSIWAGQTLANEAEAPAGEAQQEETKQEEAEENVASVQSVQARIHKLENLISVDLSSEGLSAGRFSL